ncbi:MAG: glycosyltransferase family 4 protein [bacterium]|nr:glycosyltransferase family 4 protein [bacterium]
MSKQIKILRIIARLNIGGPAIHTIILTKRLDPERFRSLLVTGIEGDQEGNMLDLLGESDLKPIVIEELGREISLLDDLKALFKLYRLIRKEKPDIVHTHTAKAGTLGRAAACLARAPIIVHTFHGHVFHSYFSPLKTKIFILIEKALAGISRKIITVSQKQKEEILGYGIGDPDKVISIPLGLELNRFLDLKSIKGRLRKELGLSDQEILIGIIARLVPVKDHSCFLSAAKIITRKHPEARFLVVGDGELRGRLESQTKELGLKDQVIFLGFRPDLDRIYADLDVVVLSSLNEGLPVAVIEAMASGLPVVATRVGGVVDLVEDGVTGRLVPPEDPEALAGGIIELLADPARRNKMGRLGRKKVYPSLSAERLVRDIENLYEDLISAIAQ